jgi:hypothetical protein
MKDCHVKDIDGNWHHVSSVIYATKENQIYPGHCEVILNRSRAICLPQWMAKSWLSGEIKVRIT